MLLLFGTIFFIFLCFLNIILCLANSSFQKELEDYDQEKFLSDYLLHQKNNFKPF